MVSTTILQQIWQQIFFKRTEKFRIVEGWKQRGGSLLQRGGVAQLFPFKWGMEQRVERIENFGNGSGKGDWEWRLEWRLEQRLEIGTVARTVARTVTGRRQIL